MYPEYSTENIERLARDMVSDMDMEDLLEIVQEHLVIEMIEDENVFDQNVEVFWHVH